MEKLDMRDLFGPNFPDVKDRLQDAYEDHSVWERTKKILEAKDDEREGLKAELTTYLAAAHTLFPDESAVIHRSMEPKPGSLDG